MDGQRYRPREDELSWQQVDDEIVVLDLAGSVYLALNGSAALLWRHLADAAKRGATVHELSAVLVDSFGIRMEQAEADASAFVSDAVARGLLESLEP